MGTDNSEMWNHFSKSTYENFFSAKETFHSLFMAIYNS
jgi:hypothetical protein